MDITDITKDNYRTKLQEIKTTDETKLNEAIMGNVVAVTYGNEGMYINGIPNTDKLIKLASSDSSESRSNDQKIIQRYNLLRSLVHEYEKKIKYYILNGEHNIKTCDEFIDLINEILKKIPRYNSEMPRESIDKLSSLKYFMEEQKIIIKEETFTKRDHLNNIKEAFKNYLSYYMDASKRYKIDPKYNIFPYDMYGDEAKLILFICDFIYNYTLDDLDSFIFSHFAEKFNVDTMEVGGKKSKKLPKKEILGKMRCIYKIPGDRKEYVKHKGKLITVKDYKELMKTKKPTKQTKPSKKTKKNNKYP